MKKKKKSFDLSFINNILIGLIIIGITFLAYLFFAITLKPQNKSTPNIKKDTEKTQIQPQKPADTQSQQIPQDPNLPPFEYYKFKYTYTVNVQGKLKVLNLKINIPQNEEDKQYIKITSVSQKPDKVYKTPNGVIGEYNYKDISKPVVVSYEGVIKTRTYSLLTAKMMKQNKTPEKDLSRYLKPEKYIESNDNLIKSIAAGITGDSQEEIIQKVYEYLQRHIKYTVIPNIGAKQALIKKKGKCSEYSAAMTAILRAKNIPARVVAGDILRGKDTPHAWVEVYFDKYGWVAFDPTHQGIKKYKEVNGKQVVVQTIYKSEDPGMSYIKNCTNEISFNPIMFMYASGQKGRASYNEVFEVQRLK